MTQYSNLGQLGGLKNLRDRLSSLRDTIVEPLQEELVKVKDQLEVERNRLETSRVVKKAKTAPLETGIEARRGSNAGEASPS